MSHWSYLTAKAYHLSPYLYEHQTDTTSWAHPQNMKALFERLSLQGSDAFAQRRLLTLWLWQPFVLAFLSIYQCGYGIRLTALKQVIGDNFISGFALKAPQIVNGPIVMLINQAVSDIRQLIDDLQAGLPTRMLPRNRMMERLLSDQLLSMFARFPAIWTHYSLEEQKAQVHLWARAFGFHPNIHLQVTVAECALKVQRKTCCLAYQCPRQTYCPDCPLNEAEAVSIDSSD